MQHTSAAQQGPSEKPALAPSATQNTPKAPARAMIPIPTFKHPRSQHRDTIATSWRDGSEGEADAIRIRDLSSPTSRMDLTTRATPRAEHHIHALVEMAG